MKNRELVFSPEAVEVMWVLLDTFADIHPAVPRDSFGMANMLLDAGVQIEFEDPFGPVTVRLPEVRPEGWPVNVNPRIGDH